MQEAKWPIHREIRMKVFVRHIDVYAKPYRLTLQIVFALIRPVKRTVLSKPIFRIPVPCLCLLSILIQGTTYCRKVGANLFGVIYPVDLCYVIREYGHSKSVIAGAIKGFGPMMLLFLTDDCYICINQTLWYGVYALASQCLPLLLRAWYRAVMP